MACVLCIIENKKKKKEKKLWKFISSSYFKQSIENYWVTGYASLYPWIEFFHALQSQLKVNFRV